MMMNQIQTVGIYCRLSRDDNSGLESNSITSQKLHLSDYVKSKGWIIYDTYVDDGYSGTNFDRPGFKRLLLDIENNKINCVIVKDLSRLGRNYLDSGYYIEKYFPEHNTRFIAVNDSYDSIEEDNDFGPFKNIINEWYAKDISKKIKFSLNTKASQGDLIQGFAPYGYIKKPESNEFEIDEEAATNVRYIFNSMYNNVPAKEIINNLKKNKVFIPGYYNYLKKGINKNKYENISEDKKYSWDYWKLDAIFTNEVYTGTLVNYKRRKISFRSKKIIQNDKDKMLITEDRFPAIISKEVFDSVTKIRNMKYRAPRNDNNIFSNMVYCEDCGKKLTLRKQGYYKNKDVFYYHCPDCKGHYMRLDILKEQVENDFSQLKLFLQTVPKESLFTIVNKINKAKELRKLDMESKEYDLSNLRRNELDNLISKLLDSYSKGIIPDGAYENMMKKYKQEYDILTDKIKRLEVKIKNKDTKCELLTVKQLEYIMNIGKSDLFDNNLIKSIIKSIHIKDEIINNKLIRRTNIEYFGLGKLKEYYEQSRNICKN